MSPAGEIFESAISSWSFFLATVVNIEFAHNDNKKIETGIENLGFDLFVLLSFLFCFFAFIWEEYSVKRCSFNKQIHQPAVERARCVSHRTKADWSFLSFLTFYNFTVSREMCC